MRIEARIDDLDITLFDAIPSQTSIATRRSLLAVHRAAARAREGFAYLEIGSHLGGSIQPYLLDSRCRSIVSIDSRPASQPDDRAEGSVATYESNTTARMMENLRRLDPEGARKVRCFESDASEVDPGQLPDRPHVALIDAEHTRRAVLSDFAFCREVLAEGGAVLFDDFSIVYPAVLEICRKLAREGTRFVPVRLEGRLFGLFFDPGAVASDPFLRRCRERSRFTLARYRARRKHSPRRSVSDFSDSRALRHGGGTTWHAAFEIAPFSRSSRSSVFPSSLSAHRASRSRRAATIPRLP